MKKKEPKAKDAIWEKAEKVLEKARPYIQMHGGDVQLVEIKNGTASLKIYGACVGCGLADATYNDMLGALLIDEVPGIKKIKMVS